MTARHRGLRDGLRWRGWTTSSRRGRAPLTGVVVVAASACGCVEVLGLDEYESAAEQLCRCDQHLPQVAGECVELLSDRLARASEPTREAWLGFFAEHCSASCDQAYDCFSQQPTCVTSGLECVSAGECCGWSQGGDVRCEGGQCLP